MNRPVVAHVYVHPTDGTMILRPASIDDRMVIATRMTEAGHQTWWNRLHRGYEVNGGTWPDVEALLTHHGVVVPPRPLRVSGAR